MKKDKENEMEDELLAEYDFAQMKGGVRGKYVERYRAGTNLVLLDPDIAQAFPNDSVCVGVSIGSGTRSPAQVYGLPRWRRYRP